MKKRNLSITISVILILALLVGCSSAPTDNAEVNTTDTEQAEPEVTTEEPKELVIAMIGDVQTWQPYERNEVITGSIQRHIFEPLMDLDKDLKWVPILATEWSSDGGHVWTIKLREGVKFQNGNDFTAEDVVFSLQLCLDTARAWADALASVESFKAIDEYTVEITCVDVDAILPSSLRNILISDKETYEGKGDEYFASNAVGTGPYKLSEYKKDEITIIERNEDYWGDKPEATKVTFKSIPNAGTRTASIIAGEVDFIANVEVRDTEILKTQSQLNVISEVSAGVMFYNMAQCEVDPSPDADEEFKIIAPDGSNPLAKRDVREAIIRAINENEIIEKIMNGYATPAPTMIPKGFNGYNPNIKKYEYDPAKAEELLDNAGYPKQDNGYRFQMALTCSNDRYINDLAQATAIASYLQKVGIDCRVNDMSRSVFFGHITISDDKHYTHFLQSGWSDQSGESVLYAKDILFSTNAAGGEAGRTRSNWGGANRGYYSNPKVDDLIDKALATADYAERDAIMQEVWQIAHDDAAIFTTLFTNDIYAVNNKLTYSPDLFQMIYAWNFSF